MISVKGASAVACRSQFRSVLSSRGSEWLLIFERADDNSYLYERFDIVTSLGTHPVNQVPNAQGQKIF
jgi:hypothetical protein